VVDDCDWYEGRATCILLGNLGEIFGGVEVFPDARPDDGMLELGVVTAEGLLQWTRTLARTALGDPNRSPFVRTTKASSVKVALDRKVRYELDGGDRSKVRSFKVKVEERALNVCVPKRNEETI
jgi:diacylglycerol kinase family enzyme